MKTYESMKLTSIKWLGMIPKHWEVIKNKHFLSERDEKTAIGNEELLSLSQYTGISIKGQKADKTGMHEAESLVGYKVVHKNDIVMNIMLAWNGSTAKSKYNGIIRPAYAVYHVMDNSISSDYLHYLFKTPQYMRYFETFSTGIIKSRLRLYPQSFLHLFTIIPPRAEQDQIVRFLDWKISEINRLIALHKDSIKTLSEFMYTLIDKAVIKGLNKSEMTINNDIRWQIEYPKHWSIFRTREHFTFRKGLSITKENLVTEGVPVISYGQIHSKENTGVGLNDNLIRFVNESYLYTDSSSIVEFGDFIFADTSEDIAGCGNCVYIDWNKTIFAGYHSIIMHPDELTNSKYMAYLFKSPTWRNQIRKAVNSVKVYTISQKILKDTFVLLPPIEEQNAIVAHLDEECDKIYKVIELKKIQILQLQEFKTQLISDVVTGKIDVRDIEIPEYEYTAEEPDSNSETEESDEKEDET